jgi:hypothetical protein
VPPFQQNESESWRILLFGQNGNEMLLFRSARGFRLPELHVPRGQRAAEHLNAEAKRLWNVETVCISPLEVSCCASPGNSNYHVMELHRPDEWASLVPQFVEMYALKEESFAHAADYAAIQKVMGTRRNETNDAARGPFADFGSFKRISTWVAQQLDSLGSHWDGEFCQLHAADSFALIRFSTNRGAFWFKAVGEPNLREFPVAKALAARFPRYVPMPLAAQTAWNAWLTAESEGHELSKSAKLTDWYQVAESLAELQIDSIHQSECILGADARDLRPQQLLEIAAPFFSAMERVMDAQGTPAPQKLNRREIAVVRDRVIEAVKELEEAQIPQTLNHLDLNPSNIFVAGGQCTFLDWAEAAFGNPFFSFQYFRQHFLRSVPESESVEGFFREAYLKRWAPLLASKVVDKALKLTPLAAVFAYASALPWDDAHLEIKPHLAGFLRSLVRRMNRESEQIAQSRAA